MAPRKPKEEKKTKKKKEEGGLKVLPPLKWPEDKAELNSALDGVLEAMLPYQIEGYVCYVWGRDPEDAAFVDSGAYKIGKENPRMIPLMVSEALKQWIR